MRLSQLESNGGRLLVVDDEPSIRTLVKQMLEMKGFHITEASSASEALRVLECHPIDLLVADVQMPAVTGLELLEIVRSEDPSFPVLLMSGSEPEQVAAKYGCPLLRKPFSLADLTAKVQALLPRERTTTSAEP